MKRILLILSIFTVSAIAAPSYPVIKGKAGQEYHTGLKHKKKTGLEGLGESHITFDDCDNLPAEFDLRTLGTIPPVVDQGSCGSCWAHSETGSMESSIMAAGGVFTDLAIQELVSCDKSQWGCEGGIFNGFKYQIEHGQGLTADMPYTSGRTGTNGRCKEIPVKLKGSSSILVGAAGRSPTEKEVKCALYKSHTMPWITVSATNAWGSPPKSETTAYSRCGSGQTNHAVGVVGWHTSAAGKSCLIMKNSWGPLWGDKGYMCLPLGCDSFGDEVAYIVTSSMPCKPPVIKLPATVEAESGLEVMIGVKEVAGVTYTWYMGTDKVGEGSMIYVSSAKDVVYKLVAKNSCGTGESSVKLKITQVE